jgi:succinate-semialdehyde dehydrogenase/glutarate-semialdehyde dehydrogenase
MALRTDLYINGEWVKGNGTLPVFDPSNGSVIAEVATAGDAECAAAVDAAAAAFPAFAKTAPRVRAEILRKAFEIMVAEADEIAQLVSRENGKVFADARAEVMYAAEFFRWFSEETVRTPGDFRKSPAGDKRILVPTNQLAFHFLSLRGISLQRWRLAKSVRQLQQVAR